MRTFFCCECLKVIRHWFAEIKTEEILLGDVCEGCASKLKRDLDDLRRGTPKPLKEVDNRAVNKARRILHEQGIRKTAA